jgi:hypothetical protein
MDLSKLIQDQLSGDALGKLSSLLNTNSDATRKATSAAAPSILAALTGLAADDEGARKLAATLGGLAPTHQQSLTHALAGDNGSLVQTGGNLMSSLFGDGLVDNIVNAVGRYANLDSATVKKLLYSIGPTILGLLAAQWKGLGGGLGALTGLLANQTQNIANAVPAGFSLANIPGMPNADAMKRVAGDTVRAAGRTTANEARGAAGAAEESTRSLISWLLPLAVLLLLAFGVWSFLHSNSGPAAANVAKNATDAHTVLKPELPAVPDVATVSNNLTDIFSSTKQALTGISSPASVADALPKLNELSDKIDVVRNVLDKLPESGQAAIGKLVGSQMAGLKEQVAPLLANPEIGQQLKPVLDGITNKLAGLNLAQVSKETGEIIASLTKTLGEFKDAAATEANAQQLQQLAGKLNELQEVQSSMSPGGKSMLAQLIGAARGPLDQLISKVLAQLGPSATVIKPVLDEIVANLTRLAEPPTTT